jgi:VanZ family protein
VIGARRIGRWLPPVVYMAAVFYVSSLSNPAPEIAARVWDKAIHFVEYGVLAILFYRAFLGEGLSPLAAALCALAATSAYGASDEWHQLFTPGRSSDVHDWFADTIGGTCGIAVYAIAVIAARRSRFPLRPRGTAGPRR